MRTFRQRHRIVHRPVSTPPKPAIKPIPPRPIAQPIPKVIPPTPALPSDSKIYGSAKIVNANNVTIGDGTIIDDFSFINAGKKTVIGKNCHIETFVAIRGGGELYIEDNVVVASGAQILTGTDTHQRGMHMSTALPLSMRDVKVGRVTIKKDAFIGTNSVVHPNVTIGEGAVVGSMSLVLHDIAPWTINYGVPCKQHGIRPRIKPTMLVLELTDDTGNTKDYRRCPLYKDYLERISRSDKINVIIDHRLTMHVRDIIKDRMNGSLPDYIFPALTPWTGFTSSSEYLRNNPSIKIIVDASDVDSFEHQTERFGKVPIRHMILRHSHIPAGMDNVKKIMQSNPAMFKDTKLHYIPPGIDEKIFSDQNLERNIDVSMTCTSNPDFVYHKHRVFIKASLKKMPYKVFTDSMWGTDYVNVLRRSKIAIVDGSMRHNMVEKYLEAPVCGALPMGEIPSTDKDIFVDGVSFVDIPFYGEPKCIPSLTAKIAYYISHESERAAIAAECKKRVLATFNQDGMVKKFEQIITEDSA